MFFLKFLTDQLDPNDAVTRSFVGQMLPALMEQYAVTSAKGGEHARDAHLNEETKRKFEAKEDQSMVSHLLNGIFPTMRLLNLLEAEGVGRYPFTETERRRGTQRMSGVLNPLDLIQTPENCNIVAMAPASLVTHVSITGDYYQCQSGATTIYLPAGMRYQPLR